MSISLVGTVSRLNTEDVNAEVKVNMSSDPNRTTETSNATGANLVFYIVIVFICILFEGVLRTFFPRYDTDIALLSYIAILLFVTVASRWKRKRLGNSKDKKRVDTQVG